MPILNSDVARSLENGRASLADMVRAARERGYSYAVDQGRRGWIEPRDVINTRDRGEQQRDASERGPNAIDKEYAMQDSTRPATAAEIVDIVGPLEDSVVLEILDTGATPAEVLEASIWANADDQIGTELDHGPRGAVVRVYQILERERPEEDERR